MNKRDSRQDESPIDASLYDTTYYLSECEGYEEFTATAGRVLSNRLATALAYADVHPGMRILDVGCGRGESLIWLAHQGAEAWGLDYATEALRLAMNAVQVANVETEHRCRLLVANARHLPFPPESFDRVLMLDIVEHLHSWELEQTLSEVWRVLEQDGKLIIHTAPNLWYYQFGYPFFRFFESLHGVQLPKDPRQRFKYHQHVHVNEQSPRSLARVLRQAGFYSHVWVEDIQKRWSNHGGLTRLLGWSVTNTPLCKWVFCGDVLAVGKKRPATDK